MRAYSVDLRDRVARAYRSGTQSYTTLSKLFGISRISVHRYVHRLSATGTLEPTPYKPGPHLKVPDEHLAMFASWIEENPSVTQNEMAARYEAETGIPISQQTVGRVLVRLGYTYKKKRLVPVSKTARM